MAFHWSEAPANMLTNAALDPNAKIPEYKVASVKAVLDVLNRAARDNMFLAALVNNPVGTLTNYHFTEKHHTALANGDIPIIEQWVGILERRLKDWLKTRLSQENWK